MASHSPIASTRSHLEKPLGQSRMHHLRFFPWGHLYREPNSPSRNAICKTSEYEGNSEQSMILSYYGGSSILSGLSTRSGQYHLSGPTIERLRQLYLEVCDIPKHEAGYLDAEVN